MKLFLEIETDSDDYLELKNIGLDIVASILDDSPLSEETYNKINDLVVTVK